MESKDIISSRTEPWQNEGVSCFDDQKINAEINFLLLELSDIFVGKGIYFMYVDYNNFQEIKVADIASKLTDTKPAWQDVSTIKAGGKEVKLVKKFFPDGTFLYLNGIPAGNRGNHAFHLIYVPYSLEEVLRNISVGLEWFPDLPQVGIETAILPKSFWEQNREKPFEIAKAVYQRVLPNGDFQNGIPRTGVMGIGNFLWRDQVPRWENDSKSELVVPIKHEGKISLDRWRRLPREIGISDTFGDGTEQYVILGRKPRNPDKGKKDPSEKVKNSAGLRFGSSSATS